MSDPDGAFGSPSRERRDVHPFRPPFILNARQPVRPEPTRIRRCDSVLVALVLLAGTACARGPVRWLSDPRAVAGVLPSDAVLSVRGAGDGARVLGQPVTVPRAGLPALGPGACLASVRWARDVDGVVAAAWWAARRDSSIVLRLSRSADDGARWEEPRTADSTDRGTRGCARPAPAVAIDARSGYTHLVYFIEPRTGAGVFYEHLMDLSGASGGAPVGGQSRAGPGAPDRAMFHAPTAIVYGETPVEASVAAHGDTVAVAYEDPNRIVPEIMLVLSVTAGHTFGAAVAASEDGMAARAPTVAVRDSIVAVAWRAAAIRPDAAPAAGPETHRAVARVGVIQ